MERWDTYNNKIHEDINDPCEQLGQDVFGLMEKLTHVMPTIKVI